MGKMADLGGVAAENSPHQRVQLRAQQCVHIDIESNGFQFQCLIFLRGKPHAAGYARAFADHQVTSCPWIMAVLRAKSRLIGKLSLQRLV